MDNTVDTLHLRLQPHKGRWPELAKMADVPVSTLRKVAQGHIKNPRIGTVDKLHRGLAQIERQS